MRLTFMADRWARSGHRRLMEELDAACALASQPDRAAAAAPGVSAWSVGDHLEHLWLADRAIVVWLTSAAAGTARSHGAGPTWLGLVVLTTGYTPRGRAEAPAITRPNAAPLGEVANGLSDVRDEALRLGDAIDRLASDRATLRHPILGNLTAAEWLRFVWLHHRHHRRIIDDILRAVPAGGDR